MKELDQKSLEEVAGGYGSRTDPLNQWQLGSKEDKGGGGSTDAEYLR